MKTKVLEVNPNFPDKAIIQEAALLLRNGKLVSFPTETVYGIGANYLDKDAIDRLYKIKKRSKSKPFTIHISSFEALGYLDIVLSKKAERLIYKFWPGPLTIVALDRKKKKIGLRMPSNKIALELINASKLPIVAPSANISGNKAPTSARDVISEMPGSVDMILDGGSTEIGIASTVLDVTEGHFKILRQGSISRKDLLADYYVLFVCTGNSCRSVMAKGMLEKFLKQAGLLEKVVVDSAGTGGFSGISASVNTIQAMKEESVDVSMHKGKGIDPELLKKSDFIFVMEDMHRDIILARLPEIRSKVRLLKESENIPDPIGKSLEEYRRVKNIIKDKVENVFLELFKKEKI